MTLDHLKNKLRPLISLNAKLNKFQYGIVLSSGKILLNDFSDDVFNDEWRLLSPADMKRYQVGVCWDFTKYYEDVLTHAGYNLNSLFIVYGANSNNFSTHTVTIVEIDGIFVWLESAWKEHCGVFVSNDFDRLIECIGRTLINHSKGMGRNLHLVIHDMGTSPDPGTTSETYMKYGFSSKVVLDQDYKNTNDVFFKPSKQMPGVYVCMPGDNGKIFMEEGEEEYHDTPFMEAAVARSTIMKDLIEERITNVLKTPEGRRKYAKIQSDYMDRNADKLSTPGPQYLIVFGSTDQQYYLDLFGITKEEVIAAMKQIAKNTDARSDFKFLTQNPMIHIFYYCIRYFTLNNDERGVNSTLGIYALAIYWSTFTKYYPKGVIEAVMLYTIDNLTNKFTIKQAGNIFNGLLISIQQSYRFHRTRFLDGTDADMCAFAQRIKNDQNSMIKNITHLYQYNYEHGYAVTTRNDNYDADNPIVDDVENSSTMIAIYTNKVVPQMISNGIDLRLAMAAAKMAQISVTDCREYLTQIITDKRVNQLESLVQSTLYIFLVTDQRPVTNIKSQEFLAWGHALFKKTNSKDPNIGNINAILDKWASESGIYERYKSPGTRIYYKKAIFLYIVLTITKYA